MADRIIATGGQLNLNALRQASRDGGYVYDDGAGNLRVSQRRMRGGFLWLGTDSRHKQGFQQLQALVKQQYGMELRSRASAFSDLRSLHRNVQVAQAANRTEMDEILQKIRTANANAAGGGWQNFDNTQTVYARGRMNTRYVAGHKLPQRVRDEIRGNVQNKTQRREFTLHLERTFGNQASQKYANATQNAFNTFQPLTEREKNVWNGYFAGKNEIDRLVAEFKQRYNGPGQNQAANLFKQRLQTRLDNMLQDPRSAPSELTAGAPELPRVWVESALEDAVEKARGEIDIDVVNQLNDEDVDENQIRGQALLGKQALDGLQVAMLQNRDFKSGIRSVPVGDQPRESGQSIFTKPGVFDESKFYEFCESVENTDGTLFRRQAEAANGKGQQSAEHLQEAKHLAALGLQLRDRGVDPKVAAQMLRMEVAERRANRGAINRGNWSPALAGNLDDYATFATDFLQKRSQSTIAPARRDMIFDQILEVEMAERRAGRNNNLAQWSAPVARLFANNQRGVSVIDQQRIRVSDMVAKLREGADNNDAVNNFTMEEAASCIQFGLRAQEIDSATNYFQAAVPQNFRQPFNNRVQTWMNAGFNRAEALYYMNQFRDDEINRVQPFAGSGLRANEIRDVQQKFQESRLPLNSSTRPGHFVDRNRQSNPVRHGSGGNNTVYSANYSDLRGDETRIFKPLTGNREELANNIASYRVGQMLGNNVIVHAESGIENGRLGLSMEKAPGKEAQQSNRRQTITVTKDSAFAHLLEYRDRIAADPTQGQKIAKRLQADGIRELYIDPESNELKVVVSPYLARKDDKVLQKQLIELQLTDYLIKSTDRHERNYMIEFDEKGFASRVVGIDNDKTFSTARRRDSGIGLPPVIDTDQRDRILAINTGQIRNQFQDLLSPAEIQGLVERVQNLKTWAREMDDNGLVIGSDEWGKPEVTKILVNQASGTNFLKRDGIGGGSIDYQLQAGGMV